MPETLSERYTRISGEQASTEDKPHVGTDNLYSNVSPMLYMSDLVYAFAYLRKRAAKEELIREDLIVPEQTSTQNPDDRMKTFVNPIDSKITVQNAVEFVTLNLATLEGGSSDINYDLFIHGLLALKKLKNAYLQHFDSDYAGKTFVYGLLVNHDQKRITVTFRGSILIGDWRANLRFFKSQLNTPVMLKENLGFSKDKKIMVHRGFKNYLLHENGPDKNQKYSQIKELILELYKSGDCTGYGLYTTGHSLGGALSTLMAFNLASSRKIATHLGNKPVMNISFASPYVGGKVWSEAFKTLEDAGKIQHIRVSNKDDVVPSVPPTPNYVHTGVHLFLNPKVKKGYELTFNDDRSLLWQWSCSPVSNHLLPEYYDRLKSIKNHLQNVTIEGIYPQTPSEQV